MFLDVVLRMQRIRRAVVAALLVCLLALCGSPAYASSPSANGRIAYTSFDDLSVHTVLPSGHGDKRVADYGFDVAAWSFDGEWLAFTGNAEGGTDIYRMQADTGGIARLTYLGFGEYSVGAFSPSYSPRARRNVFQSRTYHDSAPYRFTTMRSDGSELRNIAPSTGGAYPVWPRPGEIDYVEPRSNGERGSIWAMRPDGTHKHRLVYLGRGTANYSSGGYGPI